MSTPADLSNMLIVWRRYIKEDGALAFDNVAVADTAVARMLMMERRVDGRAITDFLVTTAKASDFNYIDRNCELGFWQERYDGACSYDTAVRKTLFYNTTTPIRVAYCETAPVNPIDASSPPEDWVQYRTCEWPTYVWTEIDDGSRRIVDVF